MPHFFLFILLLLSLPSYCANIYVIPKVERDLEKYLAGDNIEQITHFNRPETRREVAEIVLLFQALRLGGYKKEITITSKELSYLRGVQKLGEGDFTLLGNTIWEETAKSYQDIWISRPVIKHGEYIVGIYTTKEKAAAYENLTKAQLSRLTAITNRIWHVDLIALQSLHLKDIYHSTDWDAGVKMVYNNRTDFMLTPFQAGKDMVLHHTPLNNSETATYDLYPIQGVKVKLNGSRHWVVSKKDLDGKTVIKALNKGLEILDRNGVRKKAFTESHFFTSKVQSWTLLN